MSFHLPTNPFEFINLMQRIWDDDPDGLYPQWHDARKMATAIGLRRTGSSTKGGEYIEIFRFPSGAGVRINAKGSSIALASRPHRDAAYHNLTQKDPA